MILGSHNSGTGEKADNFFAKVFPCIARCQKKCLLDQYKDGVRFFDIRIREYDGEYKIHHGLARYDMSFNTFLSRLSTLRKVLRDNDDCIIMVTYEGKLEEDEEYPFAFYIKSYFEMYDNIKLGNISVKKPVWKTLYSSPNQPNYVQNYPKLIGWKAIFPFPRIWNFFKKKIETDGYVLEDFV